MSIDISQFHQTFLEEAKEHSVDLETGLLTLEESENPDMDAIFRAAHSIKGGAGTFGFDKIAEFTHVVESVLQRARDGEISPTQELTTLLLQSVDIINDLIAAAEEGDVERESSNQASCLEGLNKYLGDDAPQGDETSSNEQTSEVSVADDEKMIMEISFTPHPHLPKTGSDPINIFRELSTLGELKSHVNYKDLPSLSELDPEEMHLSWKIELITDASQDEINDAFLFVEDDADINIDVIGAFSQNKPTTNSEEVATSDSAPVSSASNNEVEVKKAPERPQPERRKSDRRQQNTAPAKETSFIRVAVDKVDGLINLVGELVTTNAMVIQSSANLDEEESQKLKKAITEMSSHTRSLQEGIMAIRMMPIDFAFSRFPRMVRDTSQKLGKIVNLETEGGQTELDKTVIERITDPLTHLVRNAIDHGLEPPEERQNSSKESEGTVTLRAYYRGGNVMIEVQDDGRGINAEKILNKAIEKGLVHENDNLSDEEIFQFIFDSGFSTAAEVTDVSGRGVGMDVVRKNIKALGGTINISSEEGKGTCFTISLPLTLAIVDGMSIQCGSEIYIIPLLNIIESIRPKNSDIKTMQDDVEVIDIRGEYLPMLRLSKAFHVDEGQAIEDVEQGIAVIVEAEQQRIALFVDDLLGERQVVIKSIEQNYKQIEGVSGATILGDGRVAFILDLAGLIRLSSREGKYQKLEHEALSEDISLEDKIAQEVERRIQMHANASNLERNKDDDMDIKFNETSSIQEF